MFESPEDRRLPRSPQLAVRVAVLGGIAFALFAIVFFRLWFLQVLSGDQYLAEAAGNRIREVAIQAPRGELIDRDGDVLVGSRRGVAVVVSPQGLPEDPALHRRQLARLSRVLGRSTRPAECTLGSGERAVVGRRMPLECRVDQHAGALPYADVVVADDASVAVYSYLAERAREFPGVEIQDAWLRSYELGSAGAHLLGTVGQVNAEELEDPHFEGVAGGSIVGKNGAELVYDPYLRGRSGARRILVDAFGQARDTMDDVEPVAGNDVRLSIDADLQVAGEEALRTGIRLARQNGNPGSGGAFVAIDPGDGEVLAMGSNPTFDPALFARPVRQEVYDGLMSEERNNPLMNRAIQGSYATGSTFKVVTAAAALAAGKVTEDEVYVDTGLWSSGAQERRNAGEARFGPVALVQALAVSVDTYFYMLGERLNVEPEDNPRGGPLQAWARKFGFGSPTGVDLPYETGGRVPDPTFGPELWKAELRCRREKRVPSCDIALEDHSWTVGDNVSLAIGQGDFLASPLQLAVAYAAIQNGGTIVRPHVGMEVLDERGRLVERLEPRPARRIEIAGLDAIRAGLLQSTTDPRGTSTDVFRGFGREVYGKTGTAQRDNEPDQSWYVAYVDDAERPIVVAAVIEDGGYGAQAAAPAVRLILSRWFGVRGEVVEGSSATG